MKTSDVLNLAADLIQSEGWTAGPAGMLVDGPHCVQGAIQAVMDADRWTDRNAHVKYMYLGEAPCEAGRAVRDYLNARHYDDVWIWNDRQTDAEAVVATLRSVAVIEAARENVAAEVSA